jgi:cyclophilin family peptidyl-prolyl cis-trans isomerase
MSRLVTRRQRKNLDPLAIDGCWPQRDNAVDETTLSKALVARLKTIVESSSDSNARVWALESLAAAKMSSALEDWLLGRLFDPDYRVRVAAAQRLASASLWGAMRLGVAARKMWKEVAANHFRLTGKRVHAVLASLEALEAHARVPMIRQVATDLLEASDGSGATVNYSPEEALSIDRVHCAAARLYDLGYGRIERSAICGTARAPQLDKSWRRRHVISVIADMERPAGWKLMMLRRYFIDRDPTVRAAALRALLEVDSKNISAPLLDGLGEKQLDVFDTAVRVSFARKTLLAGASAARLRPVVRRLHQLNPLLKPRASCTVIVGLAASQNAAVVPILRTISDGAAIATRRCARQALVSLGATPQGLFARASTSRGLPDDTWAGGQHKQPPRRAIWVSRRGEVEIELYADLAPAAVARFARLSYTQAFRGATIDRVLPGKYLSAAPVIISRDARLTLPDELTPTPVTRGSLIFVPRCGADTAGHRILVALSRLPELDGRVTVFGRVRTGLSLLHRTLAPEQIKDLYIPRLPQKRALPRRPRNKPSKPEGSPPKKNGKSGAK